jgi:hypothetical protein
MFRIGARFGARQSKRSMLKELVGIAGIVLGIAATVALSQTGDTQKNVPTPILLELFTSEGCSSCPPADKLVQEMDTTQPVSGAQLIVLSEHVDYWNHDGWKDPYSSSSLTERQIDYVRALKLKEPYTPQMIVDGTTVLQGDEAQILQSLRGDVATPKLSLRIDSVNLGAGKAQDISGHIDVEGTTDKHNADVYVAVALSRAESQVLSGENSGKHLSHVAVVQEIKKLGKLGKNGRFSQDFQVKLNPGTDANNVRIIAFVQEPGPGRVLGAALWKPAN